MVGGWGGFCESEDLTVLTLFWFKNVLLRLQNGVVRGVFCALKSANSVDFGIFRPLKARFMAIVAAISKIIRNFALAKSSGSAKLRSHIIIHSIWQ